MSDLTREQLIDFISKKYNEGAFKDRIELRKEIERTLKVKKTRAREIIKMIFDKYDEFCFKPNDSLTGASENYKKEVVTSSDINSLEKVIEYCNIDTSVWNIEKYSIEQGANDKEGNVQFRWKLNLIKDKEKINQSIVDSLKNLFDKESIKKFNYITPIQSDKMLEIDITDSHISKLCWPIETSGDDFNLKIAVNEFKETVYTLVSRAKNENISTILFPVLGDFFNSDNASGTTTAGTPQAPSEDSRWQKTFTTGCELLAEVIESLAINYNVIVPIVPGNHDYERSYYLGEFLRAYFRNHKNVKIDNTPTQRKYFTYGQNLILYTHGNEEKVADLPLIMAAEKKEEWGNTKFRFIHLGHMHKQELTEQHGVQIRVLRSLVPADAWMTSKGYIGNIRGGQAFLYDKNLGQIANYSHNK